MGTDTDRGKATRRRLIGAVGAAAAAAALALSACGGSDDGSGTASADSASAPYDITVSEFISDLAPEKTKILKAWVADKAKCDVEFKDDRFVIAVSASATNYSPSTSMTKVLGKAC